MKSKTVERLLKSTPKDIEILADWYADLLVRINELMIENKINKKELAEKLDKQPSEISKWFNSNHNFTLKSLAKLSAELGENLMEVPKKNTKPTFLEGSTCRVIRFVKYDSFEAPKLNTSWQGLEDIEPINDNLNVAG